MDQAVRQQYDSLVEKVKSYIPNLNTTRLDDAFEYAYQAHDGQKRKNGEPYIIHPIASAFIVAEMGLDLDSIIAALLHDCIEDTGATYDDIKTRFGQPVADLVNGVTKLTRVMFTSKEEEQMENLRKMFIAMAKDIRVLLIKIADRLHNMRTINYQSEAKQREKAHETMQIYAPLAHRLGMQRIKWELEDRALQCLDPVGYSEVAEELNVRTANYTEFLERIKTRIAEHLAADDIDAVVESRVKHVYSVYRKMYSQQKSMFEIYDLYAVRIIVDTVHDCYNALGIVHELFRAMPNRFKDYINLPKANKYQSLHTTMLAEGVPFEVQIRTHDMHHTAEYGIAAHWKDKSGLEGELGSEQKLEWVRRLLESQQDTEAEDFMSGLHTDMFDDEVFVFTPKGDLINLPAGSSPIDFAYAIHSAVGNRMTGVFVNGRMANFEYVLQNGDIVDILTSAHSKGPSRDWIKMVKTGEARNKIKQWFKKECREENIAHGKSEFENELKRSGLPLSVLTNRDAVNFMLHRVSVTSLDDMYAAIGYGGHSAVKAANFLREEIVRISRLQPDKNTIEELIQAQKKPKTRPTGIVVQGLDNCLIKFARCCTPIPGDGIVGFITRGYGVSIHRDDCDNVKHSMANEAETERWIPVSWDPNFHEAYQTAIQISARDRDGLVVDVATAINMMKVPLRSINADSIGGGYAIVNAVIMVKDTAHLSTITNKLSRASGVIEVKRG